MLVKLTPGGDNNIELAIPVVEVDAAVPLTAGESPLVLIGAVFHHSSLGLGGVT